jgi:thymidylate synthase
MYYNFVFDDVNDALPRLSQHLLESGALVESRAGATKELTHVGITLTQPLNRDILVKHRNPNLAAQIVESAWVLAGRNDVELLSHYLPRAADFSDDGRVWRAGYGARLRNWEGHDFHDRPLVLDQLAWVVGHLRANPGSRQAVVSIWDPAIDTAPGKDIPCNDWLSFSIRDNQLDLHVAIRSNDMVWGWSGINQFEWSVLMEVVAGLLAVNVGSLHFSVTSFHMYERHFERAAKMAKEPSWNVSWPQGGNVRFSPKDNQVAYLDSLLGLWFKLEAQIRNNEVVEDAVNSFPEPMLRSWLRVLQWWWTGDSRFLEPIQDTRIALATGFSVQPKSAPVSAFLTTTQSLHLEKHAAYGDSWMKRGELFSILPNIGRKVDRLGGAETSDETSSDTAMDLFVYLCKYRVWLQMGGNDPVAANAYMAEIERRFRPNDHWMREDELVRDIKGHFEDLLDIVNPASPDKETKRDTLVDGMAQEAYVLARTLWEQERFAGPGYAAHPGRDHEDCCK